MARKKSREEDPDPAESEDTGKTSRVVTFWLNELAAAKKREEAYRKEGRRIREIYAGDKKDSTPFNILFSNTETILPAMYSQTPRPIVKRRYKDDNRVGQAAAKAAECLLTFALDTNIEGYETFHETLKGATLDGLLPGRGVGTVKYDADTDGGNWEMICTELQSWDRVYFGYARKWSKVPWVAYEMRVDKKEAERLCGKDVANKIRFAKHEDDDEEDEPRKNADEKHTGERKTALLYQIWDKDGGRKIRYVSPQYTEGFLKVEDDTLGLTGFFNTPRPLQFIEKTDTTVPTSLYCLYENQAMELNSITIRINKLIKAMKARGIYDAALGTDVQNVMEAEENELVPSESESALATEKGLSNAIWFMPLDVLKATLEALYIARENCKTVIYEIMGIADILRGASKASETLGAQQIKNQWGSLRLKPKQAEVQRYARDLMRMIVEIAAAKFSEDTWAKVTGLPYLTQQQAQQMMQVAQAAKAKAQMGDQQALQQFQQISAQAKQSVTWAQVLEVLQDDLQRAYKIDIETNSTVEMEAAEDQKQLTELMNSIGQFMNGVGPMIQAGALPFGVAKNMLLAITRRFRFGDEIEDDIRNMQPPKPPEEKGDGGAAATAAVAKAEQKAAADKLAFETQVAELTKKLQAKDLEFQALKRDTDLSVRELGIDTKEKVFQLKQKSAVESINQKKQAAVGEIGLKKQQAALSVRAAAGGAKPASQKTGGPPVSAPAPAPEPQGGDVSEVAGILQQLLQAFSAQQQQIQQLAQAVKAPRRKKAVRGADGKIAEVIETPMDDGGTLQ